MDDFRRPSFYLHRFCLPFFFYLSRTTFNSVHASKCYRIWPPRIMKLQPMCAIIVVYVGGEDSFGPRNGDAFGRFVLFESGRCLLPGSKTCWATKTNFEVSDLASRLFLFGRDTIRELVFGSKTTPKGSVDVDNLIRPSLD